MGEWKRDEGVWQPECEQTMSIPRVGKLVLHAWMNPSFFFPNFPLNFPFLHQNGITLIFPAGVTAALQLQEGGSNYRRV